MPIGPQDLTFPVGANLVYSATGGIPSGMVSMAQGFESAPRPISDFSNFSIIGNILAAQSPQGTLQLLLTNASGTISPRGIVTFAAAPDWVAKPALKIAVGGSAADGTAITPPFDIAVPFNGYDWAKLAYTATSGSGTFYARIGGVKV